MKLTCSICKEEKDTTSFYKRTSRKRGYEYYCKLCSNLHKKKYYLDNPEKKRKQLLTAKKHRENNKDKYKNFKLKEKYNISLDDYNILLMKQQYKCKICNKIEPLFVDHCHNTGKIRGLLCHFCNVMLGFSKEDISILKSAISYLDTGDSKP